MSSSTACSRSVERHGGPDEINRMAREAGKLENLLARLDEERSPYRKDLDWLMEQRNRGAFVPLGEYRRRVGGDAAVPPEAPRAQPAAQGIRPAP